MGVSLLPAIDQYTDLSKKDLGKGKLSNRKSNQVPVGIKDWKIMYFFHLMRSQKPKIWSIKLKKSPKFQLWKVQYSELI